MGTVIIEQQGRFCHPQIVVVGDKKEVSPVIRSQRARTSLSRKARRSAPARCWRMTPRKIAKTKDITGGLRRVAELFEARRPRRGGDREDRRHCRMGGTFGETETDFEGS